MQCDARMLLFDSNLALYLAAVSFRPSFVGYGYVINPTLLSFFKCYIQLPVAHYDSFITVPSF